MGKYVIEDTVFDVLEDKTVLDEKYDIQDNILICEKTMQVVTRSSIYSYPDGFSLYLKFDDTGRQKLINLTLAIYKTQVEKQLLEFHDWVDVKINRYNNNFLVIENDPLNNIGSVSFVTVTDSGDILKSEINYTRLVDLNVIDGQLVLLNSYEDTEDGYRMWLIGVYALNGICKKVLLDKKIKSDEFFKTQVVINKKGMLLAWVDKVLPNGEEKKYTDYDLKILSPNMPAPERKVSWKERRRLEKEKKIKAEKMSKNQKETVVEEPPDKSKGKKPESKTKKTATKKPKAEKTS